MVFLPGMGDGGIGQMLLSFVMLILFFMFFPRLMLFQITYKLRKSVTQLQQHAAETETMFLNAVVDGPTAEDHQRMEPMKNMVVSPPTGIDPAGLVGKLENLLDTSDEKMERFVEELADDELDAQEKANLSMGFKGVYGTQQIYVLVRHFKELIEDTKNYQLGGMLQMMLPLYEEIAESQKQATEAFVNGVPIGDSVGPLVAAKFMENEPEELAEDVVVSEEEVDGKTVHVLKSNGPGSRLGKYGDAIAQVAENEDIGKIVFVDAGMRFEGEDTGKVVDGTGVMMGGPGVEKFKIEEVAEEHGIDLEGYIIKQSGPQASRPMHSKIYNAVPEAVDRVHREIEQSDDDLLVVGVGNTIGVANSKQSTSAIPNKLKPYWAEEEEESTSYFGLMKAFPMGGGDAYSGLLSMVMPGMQSGAAVSPENSFELFQRLVRR